MKNNGAVIAAVTAIIFGVAGFFGGKQYAQTQRTTFVRNFGQNGGQGGRFGANGPGGDQNRNTFRPVSGEIITFDDKSITVKLADGSSKMILLSDKTQIGKASEATKADLTNGAKVAVFGTQNSDGSVTAASIQLNPQLMGRPSGPTPNQAQKSADAKEIVVTGGNYSFDPKTITVKKGEKIRILFKNTEGTHDFVLDEFTVRTALIQSGQEDFVEFTPDKTGSFEYYCSFGNHRAMGMKGTFIVL